MVRAKGLEPPRPKTPEPKSGASTSSATPALCNRVPLKLLAFIFAGRPYRLARYEQITRQPLSVHPSGRHPDDALIPAAAWRTRIFLFLRGNFYKQSSKGRTQFNTLTDCSEKNTGQTGQQIRGDHPFTQMICRLTVKPNASARRFKKRHILRQQPPDDSSKHISCTCYR